MKKGARFITGRDFKNVKINTLKRRYRQNEIRKSLLRGRFHTCPYKLLNAFKC